MSDAKTLVMKLAEVMAAVERIPKRGRNDFHKYDYATEADIAATVRAELAARHIMLIPSITGEARHAVGEKGSTLTVLEMEMEFLDGESGQSITKKWRGYGTDKEDKGGYKAMTGGEKYFLLKTFLMPTGDDPERDDGKRTKAKGLEPDPPKTVVDTRTGAEVPADQRPPAPQGFRYIDRAEKKANGWVEVTFLKFDAQGGARTYATKLPQLGEIAMQAYQQGVPVHIEGKKAGNGKDDWYLNGVTTWKPEPTDAELDLEIAKREMAVAGSEVA